MLLQFLIQLIGTSQESRLAVLLQPIWQLQQDQNKLFGLCTAVVQSQKKVLTAVEELKALVVEQSKKNFSIKGSAFEVNQQLNEHSNNFM